jgi:hypothetical protein
LKKYDNDAINRESAIHLSRFYFDQDVDEVRKRNNTSDTSDQIKIMQFQKFSPEKDQVKFMEEKSVELQAH